MDSKEMAPGDIERRSFEIITEELGGRTFPPLEEPVVKRVIHTTADFSYADSLVFTHDAAHCALDALRAGATVLTDTNMALAGISKPALAKLGCKAVCYMADPDVAGNGARRGHDSSRCEHGQSLPHRGSAYRGRRQRSHSTSAPRRAHGRGEDRARARRWGAGRVCERGRGERGATRATRAGHRREGSQGGSTVAAAIMNALLYQITRTGGAK